MGQKSTKNNQQEIQPSTQQNIKKNESNIQKLEGKQLKKTNKLQKKKRITKEDFKNDDEDLTWLHMDRLAKSSKFGLKEVVSLHNNFKKLASQSPNKNLIQKDQFSDLLKDQGLDLKNKLFLERVFKAFDDDKSGSIDFRQYTLGLSMLSRGSSRDKLKFSFVVYDLDENGCISKREMKKILIMMDKQAQEFAILSADGSLKVESIDQKTREDIVSSYVDDIFDKYDRTENGVLSFDEYMYAVMNHPALVNFEFGNDLRNLKKQDKEEKQQLSDTNVVKKPKLEGLKESKYISLKRFTFEMEGKKRTWDIASVYDCVIILIFHKVKKSFIMVKQFRPPVWLRSTDKKDKECGYTYELCAGLCDKDNKSPKETAVEEVMEETGYEVQEDDLTYITTLVGNVGLTGNNLHLYFVAVDETQKKVKKKVYGVENEGENIQLIELPLDKAMNFIFDRTIAKPASLPALFMWFFQYYDTKEMKVKEYKP